jgi:hypothetical protein
MPVCTIFIAKKAICKNKEILKKGRTANRDLDDLA